MVAAASEAVVAGAGGSGAPSAVPTGQAVEGMVLQAVEDAVAGGDGAPDVEVAELPWVDYSEESPFEEYLSDEYPEV